VPSDFDWVVVNQDGFVGLNNFKIPRYPCGCLKIEVGLDINSCVEIRISQVPC
jgi:hypothetical protein